MKLKMAIEVDVDAELWFNDAESKDWFFTEIIGGEICLHSNDESETIGEVKILEIEGVEE